MISTELLLYCIGAAGAYLFVISLVWEYAGIKLNINRYNDIIPLPEPLD